jgi:hypothetical protein
MVSLPQELIDDIVSYVEDRPSQEACSLVAKTFALPSQRLLFRRMSFVLHWISVSLTPRLDVFNKPLRSSLNLPI